MPERIVDYFYTCGLEENMGLEPYESGLRSYRTRRPLPLERPFKCKILQHFPDYALNHTFDAESTSLVTMPSGVWLRTQRQMESVRYSYPKRHTFVITREDGSRVHGLALLFLSEVTHENVKEAVCSLQDLIVGTSHKDEQSIYVRNRDKLFATKAIGLISRYPFIHGLFGWLEDLWASMFLCLPCGPEAKLEPFIYKLLYETSLLEPGRFITFSGAFRSHFGYFPAVLTPIPMLLDGTTGLSAAVELPLFEYSLLELLRLIDLTDFIRLFTCVLLEHRIVLFSSAYYRLMLVAEGITCLLLPFVWSHVYAPILPMSLIHFVNAPVPYIMGIKQLDPEATTDLCPAPWDAYSSGANHFDCSSPIELTSEANVCYVYIDEGRVVVPDETPHFPNAEHVLYSMSNLLTGINFQSSANSSSLKPLTQYQSSETQAPVPRPRPPSDLSLSQWSSRKTQTSVPVRTVSTTTTGDNPTKFELGADSVTGYDTGDYNRCSYVKSCIRAANAIVSADDFPSYTHLIHFNTAARTVFLRNFANIFRDYDKFFVPERGVFESTGEKRYVCSGLHAFDKFGFLSDQPETHLQFLSAFLETQMFAAFLDYRLTRSVDRGAPSPGCVMDRHPMMPLYMTIFDHAISQIRQTTLTVPRGVADDSSNSSTFLPNQTSAHNLPPTPRAQEVAVPLPDLLNVATTPPNNTTRDTSPFGAIGFPCFVESPHMPSIVSGMLSDECISRSLDAIVCNFPHLSKEMLTMPSASSYGCDYHRMPGSNLVSILHLRSNERAHLPISSAPNSPRVNNLHQKLPIAFMSTPTKRAAPDSPTVLSRHSPSPVARSFAQSHQFAALQRSGMAQTNWDFVDALLDECKHRTKRMVLKKMGHEAVELGHTDPTVSVIEENTLVSGLCDLLDRIWSHGLNKKSGKSALWSHLVEYVRIHTTDAELDSTANLPEHTTLESNTPWFTTAPGTSSNLTTLCQQRTPLPNETIGCTPRRTAPHGDVTIGSRQFSMRSPLFTRPSASLRASNMPRSGMFDLPALFGPQISQHSLVRDVLTIRNLRDIKTDVSFARAFVRLALEKKLLSAYLSELLMDVKLLRNLYCRYAFLRCEEEREQFLIHLLSLNAVDYFSFTRMLTQAELLYKVFICTGRKHGFASTSNLSIRLHGHLGSTGTIVLPRGEATAEFRHVNLGILSIVQVGHDNSGPTPKWFIEFVLVYNVFVNHLYVFPCGHWLGRGIEDDALERILIGELVRLSERSQPTCSTTHWSSTVVSKGPILTSIGQTRSSLDTRNLSAMTIHEQLANAVNQLLRYFCKTSGRQSTTNLTSLFYGERGLIPSLQLLFGYGFRSARFFQRRIYVWDYIGKAAASFAVELGITLPATSTPSSPLIPLATGQESSGFSAHSLPRLSKNRPIAGSFTPRFVRPSPSFCTTREARANTGAYSQPNSPAPMRIFFSPVTQPHLQQSTFHHVTSRFATGHMSMATLKQSATQFVQHVVNVSVTGANLGKEGRLQRLLCRAVRDHLLASWFPVLALSPITSQMYDSKCFFLNSDLRQAAQSLISALDEFQLPMESVLLGEE